MTLDQIITTALMIFGGLGGSGLLSWYIKERRTNNLNNEKLQGTLPAELDKAKVDALDSRVVLMQKAFDSAQKAFQAESESLHRWAAAVEARSLDLEKRLKIAQEEIQRLQEKVAQLERQVK